MVMPACAKRYQFVFDAPPPKRWGSMTFNTEEELVSSLAALGFKPSGLATGNHHLNPALIGAPTFHNLVGPMGNGTENGVPVIRYETAQVAALLSQD